MEKEIRGIVDDFFVSLDGDAASLQAKSHIVGMVGLMLKSSLNSYANGWEQGTGLENLRKQLMGKIPDPLLVVILLSLGTMLYRKIIFWAAEKEDSPDPIEVLGVLNNIMVENEMPTSEGAVLQ